MESAEESFLLIFKFVANFVVTKTTAVCMREEERLLCLSSLLGVALSFLPQIFALSNLGVLLFQLGISIWYICICFQFSTLKKFVGLYLCHSVLSLFYLGLCVACKVYFGIKSLFLLNVLILVLYFLIWKLMEKFYKKKLIENFAFDAKIVCGCKKIECKAFLDSGNLLFDPLTNLPISFVSLKVFEDLFDSLSIDDLLRKSENLMQARCSHFVNFKTFGGCGQVFVFQVDEIIFSDKREKDVLLGISLKSMGQKFGADIVLHNAFSQI